MFVQNWWQCIGWFIYRIDSFPILVVVNIMFIFQIQMPVGERHPSFWCVRDWDRPLLWKFYELYMLVLVLIVPLVIMSYTYSTIAREICSVTSSRSAIIQLVDCYFIHHYGSFVFVRVFTAIDLISIANLSFDSFFVCLTDVIQLIS